uniref:Uncharacterized protein n=1 Tax=Callithrix jacchus TaxID=9483 RepID=A0A8I3WMD5_CALJA
MTSACLPCHRCQRLVVSKEPTLLWRRLKCNGVTSAHCNLRLPCSSNSLASDSQVAGTKGTCHRARLRFVFLVEAQFHLVGQVGLEHLTSVYPPFLAS